MTPTTPSIGDTYTLLRSINGLLNLFERGDTGTECPLWMTWRGVLRYRPDLIRQGNALRESLHRGERRAA